MPTDDLETAVPVEGEGEAQAPSEPQTEEPITAQAQAPEQPTIPEPSAPPNAEEVLRLWISDALKQELPKHLESFATKAETKVAAQSASDQRFAKLMRELAPEMRGIDTAAKRGLIDEEQAKQAKKDLFLERASALSVEDEPPAQAQETPQMRAERMMRETGTWWNDFPEVQNGRTMPIDQFEGLIRQRATERKASPPAAVDLEALKAQVLKELLARQAEEKKTADAQAVRDADKSGATKPPPAGVGVKNPLTELERMNRTGPPDDPKAAQEYLKKLKTLGEEVDRLGLGES